MDPQPPPNLPTSNHDAATTLIRHFSADVQAAYARLQTDRSPADADLVILAVVRDHMPDKNSSQVDLQDESLGLIGDLGFDSVAIAEMVFFIEDLFCVQISNNEIMTLRTLGDLRRFVREKLATPTE